MDAMELLRDLGVADVADIGLVALLLYGVLVALRRARSKLVLSGLILLGLVYVVALSSGMRLTAFLFQGFFTVILVVVVVIFQEELRAFLERIAGWLLHRDADAPPVPAHFERDVDTLVSALTDFARDRTGALVVMAGRDSLKRHIHAGTDLDGFLSEPLLKSLFDASSIGHDGAAVIERGRLTRFSCHLPLSEDVQQLAGRGTRHSAALGLSEVTDALCIVVSEERGTISTARHGELTPTADATELRRRLVAFHREIHPPAASTRWFDVLRRDLPSRLIALFLSVVLWFLFSHEAAVEYRSFRVPVEFAGVGDGLAVDRITPRSVQVIVSGPRRTFYFVEPGDFGIVAKVFDAGPGASTVTLAASDVVLPAGLTFVNLIPRTIDVSLTPRPPR